MIYSYFSSRNIFRKRSL